MRSSRDNTNLQNQHYERLYDLLIGSSIDIETQLISSAISKSGKVEKQIEDVQAILNEHKLKILQNTLVVIESIVNSGDAQFSFLNFKKVIEDHQAKYRQIQLLHQMKSVLNNKIVQKIDFLNNLQIENKEQTLSELQLLNDSLVKVESALSQISSHWDAGLVESGFSVLKDLQISQQETQSTNKNEVIKEILMNQELIQKKSMDIQNDESNLYADEIESIHDSEVSSNQQANQVFQFNQNNGNNNQSYQSYYKTPKDDQFHSNLKLITPIVQKLHSIGYKTEPDSAMTPLHSDYITKNNIYKTPSDSNNNKKLFKNNLNIQHQSNIDSRDINHRINSDGVENSNSYNPPALQVQGSETVSVGDLISPIVVNNDERQIRGHDCTSFNKSEESSSKQFTLQFDISVDKINEGHTQTFGNGNNLQNNLRSENSLPLSGINSLFTNKFVEGSQQNQQQMPEESKNKLIDMFDACLNSLQQPDLMGLKKPQKVQDEIKQQIIEEDERQNESLEEFVLNEKELIDNFLMQNDNSIQQKQQLQLQKDQETIKFNGVNISNVQENDEIKGGDNSFFSQKDSHFYPLTQGNNQEEINKQSIKNDNNVDKFVSTFGLNSTQQNEQINFLEKKFGKDHFEVDQLSFEKELEDKLSVLKKQLFQSNPLGNLTAQFKDQSLFQNNTNFDTIKPVVSRKDEMEALGDENYLDEEQFKIVEESEELNKLDNKNNNEQDEVELCCTTNQFEGIENNDGIEEIKIKKNRKVFEESNRFYQTIDEDTFKEIYQNKFIKAEQNLNNQIKEDEQENEQNQQGQEDEQLSEEKIKIGEKYEQYGNEEQEDQKNNSEEYENQEYDQDGECQSDEDAQYIPKKTLKEAQFMQPFSQEYSNSLNGQQNLANEFLIKSGEQKQDIISDKYEIVKCSDKLNTFDDLNEFIEKQQQQLQDKKNDFGIQKIDLSSLNQNKMGQQSSQKFTTEEVQVKEVSEEDVLNTKMPLKETLQDSIRFNELRKCRVFGTKDFFYSSNQSNSNEKKQSDESFEEQKEDIENLLRQKLVQFKNNSQTISNKPVNKQKNQQNELEDSDEDFERDENIQFENDIKVNIQKPKLYQNFMKSPNNFNIQNKQMTFSNNFNNKIKLIQQNEDDNNIQDQQEFVQTAHFLNQENFISSIKQQSEHDSISKIKMQEEVINQEQNNIQEEKNSPKILEEPIESFINDYPQLFQNAQLQQLIAQQQKLSSNDLTKTTKVQKNIPKSSISTSSNIKNQKPQINQIENKPQTTAPNTNKSTIVTSSNKKVLPKKPSISQQNNPTPAQQHQNISQQQVQPKKASHSISQLPIPQPQQYQEKENQKFSQNSEQKLQSPESQDQNESSNLQKTLKNIKSKLPTTSERLKGRSSSSRPEEIECTQQQQIELNNITTPKSHNSNEQIDQQQALSSRVSQNTPRNKQQQVGQIVSKKVQNTNVQINKRYQDK